MSALHTKLLSHSAREVCLCHAIVTAQERAPIEELTEKWWGTFTSELNIIRGQSPLHLVSAMPFESMFTAWFEGLLALPLAGGARWQEMRSHWVVFEGDPAPLAHVWWKNPELYHVASGLYQISPNTTPTPPPTANRDPSPAPLLPPTLHFDPLSDESDEAKKSDASDNEGSVGGDLPDLPELPAVGGNTLDNMDIDIDTSTVQGPPNAATVPQEDVAIEDAPGANQVAEEPVGDSDIGDVSVYSSDTDSGVVTWPNKRDCVQCVTWNGLCWARDHTTSCTRCRSQKKTCSHHSAGTSTPRVVHDTLRTEGKGQLLPKFNKRAQSIPLELDAKAKGKNKSNAAKSDGEKSNTGKSNTGKSDGGKSDTSKSDTAKSTKGKVDKGKGCAVEASGSSAHIHVHLSEKLEDMIVRNLDTFANGLLSHLEAQHERLDETLKTAQDSMDAKLDAMRSANGALSRDVRSLATKCDNIADNIADFVRRTEALEALLRNQAQD
ncbi:hypothetical protein OF83DRAFT_1180441 [Amylostereum chailletii]|nr:hypothetical protein OF83DRAFT_1180441 [Amylostereum chailletii]